MRAEEIALLEQNIDRTVEFEMLDGTRFLGVPLFVYTGEDNPDVFLLPAQRDAEGVVMAGKDGQSVLLEDIRAVRRVSGS